MTELEQLIANRTILRRALAPYYRQQEQLATLAEIEKQIAALAMHAPASFAASAAATAVEPVEPAEPIAPVVYETTEAKQSRRKSK